MNLNRALPILLKVVFVVLFIMPLTTCNRTIKVNGDIIYSEKSLPSQLKLRVSLFQYQKEAGEITVRVTRNGHFSFQVDRIANLEIEIDLQSFVTDYPEWYEYLLSCEMKRFAIDSTKKKMDLPSIYLTDLIRVKSPPERTAISLSEDSLFEWQSEPLAERYSLNLYKKDYNELFGYRLVLAVHNIKGTKVSLKEMIEAPLAWSNSSYKLGDGPLFLTMKEVIEPGFYDIEVDGYYYDEVDKDYHRLDIKQCTGYYEIQINNRMDFSEKRPHNMRLELTPTT